MKKRIVLILLLSFLLPFCATIQNVNATWYIQGWIGKYLSIGHVAVDPWELKVNQTVAFEIFLQNWEDIFVKTIDVRIKVADAMYNETLVKDTYWQKPPDALAGAVYKLVKLTPHEDGLMSFRIHAAYQYTEGPQTLEQEGTFELLNAIMVVRQTYSDLSNYNSNLRNEIYGLNSTIQNQNASYSTLQTWSYFLAATTLASILTTLVTLTAYIRERKRSR